MKTRQKLLQLLYKGDNKLSLLDQRYLPRWIVVLIDTFLCVLSAFVTYLILYGTPIIFLDKISLPLQGLAILGINLVYFFIFKTYSGIIRHSTFTDILKLALSSIFTLGTLVIINFIASFVIVDKLFLTTSLLLYMFISFILMLLFRIAVKESYQFLKTSASGDPQKRVAIVGVDDHTISLAKALTTESNMPYRLVCFISKNVGAKRVKILGKPVIPVDKSFFETIRDLDVDGVIIISESLTGIDKNELVQDCIANGKEVFNVPIVEKWNKKEDIKNQIKPIDIEDLLDRDPIEINNRLIKSDLYNKIILVTGGAGSIGSEIVLQVAKFEPKLIVILDQAESTLYELQVYLDLNNPDINYIIELADISNMHRLGQLFSKYEFDIIYHAAAYKHVPLIERNPHEAVYVNILGTVNLAILSVSFDVATFVFISTDKAVNPTNVMGASKRVAEMYVQSLYRENGVNTRFITTRFGNVLGSSGSVIPHFRKQISQGGPITLTHKNIIRYFMTIPEACQLVLQAGTMGNGGEIFVFDMGKPVKILDLAERMILLSGLEPYEDIDIKIIGLRPGEKLFEELLSDSATTLPTHHPKIMVAKVPTEKFVDLKVKVRALIKKATKGNDVEVVMCLKELVPEFKSQNSEYEELDDVPLKKAN